MQAASRTGVLLLSGAMVWSLTGCDSSDEAAPAPSGTAGSPAAASAAAGSAKPRATGDDVPVPSPDRIVSIAVAEGGPAIAEGSAETLVVSTERVLRFRIVVEDQNYYRFTVADRPTCMEHAPEPDGFVLLAACASGKAEQQFAITGTESGHYIAGAGYRNGDVYLYQGADDSAIFEVTPDAEPTRWVFVDQG